MARTKAFTRETALAYLAERHLLTKNPDSYTTSYLTRIAPIFRKYEQSGEDIYDKDVQKEIREEARGHAAIKVYHTPLQNEGEVFDEKGHYQAHNLEAWHVKNPETSRHVAVLLRKTNKDFSGNNQEIFIKVTGIPDKGSPSHVTWKKGDEATYAQATTRGAITTWLERNKTATALDFANYFFSPLGRDVWLEISRIDFAIL